MTITEFTQRTGYVPRTTAEFDAIERDRITFHAPADVFCKIWINCYYPIKRKEIEKFRKRLGTSEPDRCEAEAYDIMLANMLHAYRQSWN